MLCYVNDSYIWRYQKSICWLSSLAIMQVTEKADNSLFRKNIKDVNFFRKISGI
ncbi:hypothetical protein EDB35_13221 [Vibrio crassostreae]|nr:hypothetical protein EDB35_13221 [Vibrio crassostreae]TCN95651.1 hypothetical protein EDB30_12131 [Vibrio crassostreae]TCU02281.1 hypothetical protein EDB32_13423 [Vibrio crassostreae]